MGKVDPDGVGFETGNFDGEREIIYTRRERFPRGDAGIGRRENQGNGKRRMPDRRSGRAGCEQQQRGRQASDELTDHSPRPRSP